MESLAESEKTPKNIDPKKGGTNMAVRVKVTRWRKETAYIDIDESDLLDPTSNEQAKARAVGIVHEDDVGGWTADHEAHDYEYVVAD